MNHERRVLVVDDDSISRMVLREALSISYRVDAASDIFEALEYLDTSEYAVVVTDLVLQGHTGIDIAKQIRKMGLDTEVIVVTGHDSLETVREAIHVGVNYYLTKPLNTSELRSLVKQSIYTYEFNRQAGEILQSSCVSGTPVVATALQNAMDYYNIQRQLSKTRNVEDAISAFFHMFTSQQGCSSAMAYLTDGEAYYLYFYGGYSEDELFSFLETSLDQDLLQSVSYPRGLPQDDICFYKLGGTNRSDITSSEKMIFSPLTGLGSSLGFIGLFGDAISLNRPVVNRFYTCIPIITPVIKRIYLEQKINHQAQTDTLTGIANRRMLEQAFHREIKRALRYGTPISVVMIDLDDFKQVNDTHGHIVGDSILKDFVQKVNGIIRGSDLFARYGGEEFTLILPETEKEGALHLAEKVRSEIETTGYEEHALSVQYTISLGVSCISGVDRNSQADAVGSDTCGKVAETAIHQADQALYQAKEMGKNRAVLFQQEATS
ncbi:GGDEF domain-containing response regulator [Chitinivibrio alkaliphilus]|uniref:diguanylate cyclase n=1 Tax=Chitinivibrio alkaliphilus ACht1 TaxID=1313304 RepID=U7D9M2_9BACT|nr:GGDEF domain-containing response regulator [Chitinivibrio alkaliphilus]ERP31787.1 diguanylate cyclase [Chitinivibrio alkaliphilus ACht1]